MKSKLATLPVLITAVFICPYFNTLAQSCTSSAGANNATSFSTMAFAGSSFTWINTGNAQTSDNNYASGGISLGAFNSAYSDYLTIQNFGFSIPSTATICEIHVEVERSVSGLGLGGKVSDQSIRLLKGGSLSGNDLASSTAWPGSDGSVTYGNGLLAGTWGGSWLPSDINSTNFGVAISSSLNTGIIGLFMQGRIDLVRVTVVYDPNSILATGLESFTATRSSDGDGHILTWTTGNGASGYSCTIQRSGDSRRWQDIATVANTYSYVDHTPLDGANFYRLRMESKDGRFIYSTVKEVELTTASLRCFPNPFVSVINLSGLPAGRITLKDMQGRVLYVKDVPPGAGNWQIPAAGLPSGLYFVEIGNRTFKMLKPS